jgi:hypothetical protein
MKLFLYLMILIGGLIPLILFFNYFSEYGFSGTDIVMSLFGNPLMSGFTADILISIFIFLVWTFFEFKENLRYWFLLLFTSCLVGLSLSLPIYLLIRLTNKNNG